jgi:ribosome-associated protein
VKIPKVVVAATEAALDKKAENVVVLDLRTASSFTDYFVLATGTSQKQVLAIADSVLRSLRDKGLRPSHSEGYPRQEWILLDFGGLVVHVFTPRLRDFYDLERLWGGAARQEMRARPPAADPR